MEEGTNVRSDIHPEILAAAERLFYWHAGSLTSFTAQLYDLIQKADPVNRESLRMGFPLEVSLWEEWQESPSPKEFFARYGIKALL